MIARHWRGWTKTQDADAYETLLKTQVLPDLAKIAGYRGGYVLRGNAADEVEFVIINLFDSIEAVRAFAGPNYSTPVFEPEARLLLSRIEFRNGKVVRETPYFADPFEAPAWRSQWVQCFISV